MKKRRGHKCHSHRECHLEPLSRRRHCGRIKVCKVNGDRKHCARLASLGLYPGNEIEVLCPAEGGKCLIKVHGGTISIDSDSMENILVSE